MRRDKRSLFWQLDFQLQESHGLGFSPAFVPLGLGCRGWGRARWVQRGGGHPRATCFAYKTVGLGWLILYFFNCSTGWTKTLLWVFLCFGFALFVVIPEDRALLLAQALQCGLKQRAAPAWASSPRTHTSGLSLQDMGWCVVPAGAPTTSTPSIQRKPFARLLPSPSSSESQSGPSGHLPCL